VDSADKALLFVEFLGAANFVFANYMTLVFAMLTASWFLARSMSAMVAGCFLFLYTLSAIAVGSGVLGAFSDFFALHTYLLETSDPNGDLRWLGPVAAQSTVPPAVANGFATAVVLLAWAGSMVFFFVVRREKREGASGGSEDIPKVD
jgi:hypothetical protein